MSATRSSRRRHWDAQRIREAVRGEIDSRTWVTSARITETFWDPALGWMVRARAYGTQLEGVELDCRQASSLAGIDAGEYLPLAVGAEVLITLPDGSVEDDEPLVIAGLTNGEDVAPSAVNGLPIDGETTESSTSKVSPHDTEIKVSPHGRREQYAKDRTVQARAHVLTADEAEKGILLGSPDAGQSFLLGEELVARLIAAVEGLQALLAGTLSTAPGSPVGLATLPAWEALWSAPVTGLKAQLQSAQVLSKKIKGE